MAPTTDNEPRTTDQTVPRQFLDTVRRLGPRVALRHKEYGIWRDISWNDYYEQARNVGMALRAMGLQKGDRVAVIGDNCPEWLMIDLGVQGAGGVTVGVYTTNAWEQCRYLVNHSEAAFLFVENEEQLDKWLRFRDEAPTLQKIIVWDLEGLRDFTDPMLMTFDDLLERGRQEAEADPDLFESYLDDIAPDDTVVIVYTSGTTGPPKGAMLTHRNVLWTVQAYADLDPQLAPRETDEVMSFLPLCHIFERLFSVFTHLTFGYTVNFVESLETVPENLREISPTLGYGVPRVWEKYASLITIKMADATWFKRTVFGLALKIGQAHAAKKLNQEPIPLGLQWSYRLAHFAVFRKLKERLGFDRMRVAITGAAPIAPDVLRFYHAIGLNIVEGYGLTESGGVISAMRTDRIKLGTVGQALPGLEWRIADDGEIVVRSPGVFKGYFKEPEKTARTIDANGWLYTGDIGELDEEGFLRIVDRKKDLIITAGGKNIAPQYIENKLKFSPYINDAVVVGDRRKFLTALVVLDEDNVAKYAQDHKVAFSTYAELADNPAIIELIEQEVNTVNKQLARVENIRKFRILPKRLYEEDGEVTPTMKVKRTSINKQYADLIEGMYAK
ncbi:MAG: long-chain fatty acid--CoA ligase [Bacteroidetes bacterium]|nr:long-chain fatty acid--CoA ligase [Bacteroidota bacterium]